MAVYELQRAAEFRDQPGGSLAIARSSGKNGGRTRVRVCCRTTIDRCKERIMSLRSLVLAILLLAFSTLTEGSASADDKNQNPQPPAELAEFFRPPDRYKTDLGKFRSPLLFADGQQVRTAEDWKRRRAEILATWHKIMGPWPELIARPRVETVKTTRRDTITQLQLRLGIALGEEMVDAFLLVPDGKGPFPAVLVV